MTRLLANPLSPLSRQQLVSLFLSRPVCRRSSLLTGDGRKGGGGRGTKSYGREKAWPSVNQSKVDTICLKGKKRDVNAQVITCERDQQLVEVSAKALAFQILCRFYMRTLTSDCALSKIFVHGRAG